MDLPLRDDVFGISTAAEAWRGKMESFMIDHMVKDDDDKIFNSSVHY